MWKIMSCTRRNFKAKFKSDLVLELLKGEKDLNSLASENSIHPNLLRNWKKEFPDKASVVFDDWEKCRLPLVKLRRNQKLPAGKKMENSSCQHRCLHS